MVDGLKQYKEKKWRNQKYVNGVIRFIYLKIKESTQSV
jgi:hypothetical protein